MQNIKFKELYISTVKKRRGTIKKKFGELHSLAMTQLVAWNKGGGDC